MPENRSAFIDSNIWLYAFIAGDPHKTEKAQAVIKASQPVISTQIINEVCVNLIKKAGFPEEQVARLIETFYTEAQVVETHRQILLTASQLRTEYSLSFWDSLVIAAALEAEVTTLYSEDLQAGLIIHQTLQIINPFTS